MTDTDLLFDAPDFNRGQWMRDYRRVTRKNKPAVKIAVLDMETDPFDNANNQAVHPFCSVLYSEHFNTVVIWDEDWIKHMERLRDVIMSLPDRFIIYAHNGGRFDYLLLLRELRGQVLFKGRSLMSAKIGAHELRDSFHIIPESLKNANRKTEIDYSWFTKSRRSSHRDAIISYCIDDCKSLYELVSTFKDRYGTPITIGQAAMAKLKESYQFERLSQGSDAFFRNWFFGGRVECIKPGVIYDNFSLYDVNSMYPFVMATYPHPVSSEFMVDNKIRRDTVFLTIRCRNNGALVGRADDGSLTTQIKHGIFNTTIWEYDVALRHNLIRDVEVLRTVQFTRYTDFKDFILPLYSERQTAKEAMQFAERAGDISRARALARDVLFLKLLMNNAYGKFAQNPRRFKTHFITNPCERPPDDISSNPNVVAYGDLPDIETDAYWIWCKPSPDFRYNNVATAASITGAARSVLLDALATSVEPIYCDTDSIICRSLADTQHIDALALGSWDVEAKLDAYIGNGKKLYAYRCPDKVPPKHHIIKAKGVNGVTWDEMLAIADGQTIIKPMKAPTIGKDGSQIYMKRSLRRTDLLHA